MMLHHEKKRKLYNPLLVEYDVCESDILYKYRVILIVFFLFIFAFIPNNEGH